MTKQTITGGCKSCGIEESYQVFELPAGAVCESCHQVRHNVVSDILDCLSKEPLAELLALRGFLLNKNLAIKTNQTKKGKENGII